MPVCSCLVYKKSHRVRAAHGANKIQSVFCGGVYVAKNTLRGACVAAPPTAGQGAKRSETPSQKKAVRGKAPDGLFL